MTPARPTPLSAAAAAATTLGALVALAAPTQAAPAAIGPGWTVPAGTSVPSADGLYRLDFQTDGNLVEHTDRGAVLWNAGIAGRGASRLTLQTDGNLVAYTGSGRPVWASGTAGRPVTRLVVQDDGSIVLATRTSTVWSTGPSPVRRVPDGTNTLTPGHGLLAGDGLLSADKRYQALMQTDGNLVVYGPAGAVWSARTGGSGATEAVLQTDGNVVLYGPRGAVWSTGTAGRGGTALVMQTDSNLVLYAPAGPLWAANAPAPAPPATSAAAAVVTLLNQERARNGLPALVVDPRLTSSAHGHDLAMSAAGTLSHQEPGEPVFSTRITNAGYRWRSAGENIGVDSDTSTAGALALEQSMYDETPPDDGHRRNILSAGFVNVGVDVYVDGSGRLWLTEDFGAPA